MPKKLIEVALPLEAINREASREKSIRHGHPSTLHLWWARRPLAAARAVLFASLVDDPGTYLPPEEAQRERERLFDLLERLVNWDNVKNPQEALNPGQGVIAEAQYEIAKSLARSLGNQHPPASKEDRPAIEALLRQAPPVLDPFAGGGTIPLEAQRLGLSAHAGDLNPVAVLLNKALLEIPARFAGLPPMNPEYRKEAIRPATASLAPRASLGMCAITGPGCARRPRGASGTSTPRWRASRLSPGFGPGP
jgi:putative DNA methylase